MKKRLKIIRMQSRICIGGPAIHVEMLSKYLPQDRYETILVGGRVEEDEKDKSEELRSRNINVILLDKMKRQVTLWDDWKSLLQLIRLLRRERPDIVCTHTAKAGAIGRIAAFIAGVPLVVHTFHGHVFRNYFGKLKTFLFIQIERLLALATDQIITISPSQYKDITETFKIAPARKVAMVRLGLELQPLKNLQHTDELKSSIGLPPQAKLLGFVGRLVPVKNIGMAIQVLERLLQEDNSYHLCFAGDGEEREKWVQYTRQHNIDEHVHFLGWIEKIEYVLAGIDILILTSLNEGTPIAVIEAMTSQVPVVATAVGGVPDLIQHEKNGFLVSINDVESMVQYIKRIVSSQKEIRTMLENAATGIIEHYEYHHLVREIDEIYSRLYETKTK